MTKMQVKRVKRKYYKKNRKDLLKKQKKFRDRWGPKARRPGGVTREKRKKRATMDICGVIERVAGLRYSADEFPLPMRKLGNWGPLMPILGLGGQSVFELGTMKESEKVFDAAYEAGVRYIDTAHDYGESQERLGKLIAGIDDLFIATKIGQRDYDGFMRELDENIERLGRNPDMVQIHAINPHEEKTILQNGGTLEVANEAKLDDGFSYLGLTSHAAPQTMTNIVKFGDGIDSALVAISAADTRFLDAFIPEAREKGVAIIGMKVFGRMRLVQPGGPGVTTAEEALRFVWSCPVDVAIVGFSFPAEVKDCARIAEDFVPMDLPTMRDLVDGTALYSEDVMFYRDGLEKWDDVPGLRPSMNWYYGMVTE